MFVHPNCAAASLRLLLPLCRNKEEWSCGSDVQLWSERQRPPWHVRLRHDLQMGGHNPLHGIRDWSICAKTFMYITLLSLWVNPVSHLNMAVVLFLRFISSPKEFQHLFNKSEKGCKQNALCCSNHDWRAVGKLCRDIKAMQRASLSLWAGLWYFVIGKPLTSNTCTEKIMEECQVRIRGSSDVTVGFNPAQKEGWHHNDLLVYCSLELWVRFKMRFSPKVSGITCHFIYAPPTHQPNSLLKARRCVLLTVSCDSLLSK